MKLEDLENYRENGYINMDKVLLEHPELADTILRETRGTIQREKDWVTLEDCSILLRTHIQENIDKKIKGSGLYSSYSELLVKELADQVGIPAAHYDLIRYKGQPGVLSKKVLEKEDETLILYRTLLQKLKSHSSQTSLNIEDVFSASKFLRYDGIDKDALYDIIQDVCKVVVFDILTSNTDRNPGNLAILYSAENKTAKLAPIFDNEFAFGGILTKRSLDFAKNADSNYHPLLVQAIDTAKGMMTAPFEFSDEFNEKWVFIRETVDSKLKIPERWQTLLSYISDSLGIDDVITDFCEDCCNNIDLQSAFQNIEKKTKCEVPSEFKILATNLYNNRKNYISKVLCLDTDIRDTGTELEEK